MYIADQYNHRIRKVTVSTTTSSPRYSLTRFTWCQRLLILLSLFQLSPDRVSVCLSHLYTICNPFYSTTVLYAHSGTKLYSQCIAQYC